MAVAINTHGSRNELPGGRKMKKLFVGLMLVAIVGVGAASASAQGFDRGRRVTVIETTRFGNYDGDRRNEYWRRLERERIERERLAQERWQWNHRFGRDNYRDRDRDLRFRRF
jgi:hypothetical protein